MTVCFLRTKLLEYSSKIANQEIENTEYLGRKTTTLMRGREDTDDYLTMDGFTGESFDSRGKKRKTANFTENLLSSLNLLNRKSK